MPTIGSSKTVSLSVALDSSFIEHQCVLDESTEEVVDCELVEDMDCGTESESDGGRMPLQHDVMEEESAEKTCSLHVDIKAKSEVDEMLLQKDTWEETDGYNNCSVVESKEDEEVGVDNLL